MTEQMNKLAYYSPFFGFSSPPAIELAAKVVSLMPREWNMGHAMFTCGGSETNDTNMKIARLYWAARGKESKKKINQSLRRIDQKNGMVIFTDMFGGTPSNLSFSFLKDNKVEIITGVNLPMLIKFCSLQRNNNLKEVSKKVVEQGKKNIHLASALLSSKH